MLIGNDVSRSSTQSDKQNGEVIGWRELATQRPTQGQKRRRRVLIVMIILLLITLIFAAVRLASVMSATNDQLTIHIGSQQAVTLDLRQSLPISPTLAGVNVFPRSGTVSNDQASGFMDYSPLVTNGLTTAQVKLLRFPGGQWGETHYLSYEQLGDFAALLQQVNADGMIQARLSGPIGKNFTELTDVTTRADIAARWVDFMNNQHSDLRVGKYAHAPYHPVKYWTVGDEPDKLIDPATGKLYTVKAYVQDFIQYSIAMHHANPNIKVYGPEISEFYGPGAGPVDANGQLWMEGFLRGVGAYEKANNITLLDGISFHRYQFANASQAPYTFLSGTGEWNYLLPALHLLISQNLAHDVPIAISEINTNPPHQPAPSRGIAALWWADTVGTLMNQQVTTVAFSSATGGDNTSSLLTGASEQPTPMLRVLELFSHLQDNLIPLEIQRDPISVYATEDDGHQTISLLFINKSPTPQLAQLKSENSLFSLSPWHNLNIRLQSYGIAVITLHRGGEDDAYSFRVPVSNDTTTAPVIHTLCGHNTDLLSNTTSC